MFLMRISLCPTNQNRTFIVLFSRSIKVVVRWRCGYAWQQSISIKGYRLQISNFPMFPFVFLSLSLFHLRKSYPT